MNPSLSVLCLYICITICSTEKLKNGGKLSEKRDKEKHSYHNVRPTFKTKEDISPEYLDTLVESLDISEDPVGDHELEQKRHREEHGYFYDNDRDNNITYTKELGEEDDPHYTYITKDDAEEHSEEAKENKIDSNKTCPSCQMHEREKEIRLEHIKQTLLFKLGFSSNNLPNVSRKSIPNIPAIQRFIENTEMMADAPQSDDDYIPEDEIYGQVKKAYTIGQRTPKELGVDLPGATYFDLPESVTSRRIHDSSLWIYIRPKKIRKDHHKRDNKTRYTIKVNIIHHKAKEPYLMKGPVRYKKTSSGGWYELKMSHITHHWARHPTQNRGIVIQVNDTDGNNAVVTPDDTDEEDFFPMLEMSTVEHNDRHHRSKRFANNVCTDDQRINGCCRYPLRVDFVNFGWDWVIAPTGYMANYCSGECRYRHLDNNPGAYLLQQVPEDTGPCCTPSKYFPLAMLYFDHRQTVLYTFMQKMVVDRCGCA